MNKKWIGLLIALLMGCSVFAPQPADLTATPQPATLEPENSPETDPTATTPAELPELLLVQTQEGGIAGFCDQAEIGAGGEARLVTCRESEPAVLTLDADRLSQLIAWAEMYQPFEVVQEDDAIADSMTVTTRFNGIGAETAPEEVRQAVQDFAAAVMGDLRTLALGPTVPILDGGQPEEIYILSPGPGSRVTSPILVQGMADATFEQNLVVSLILPDGTELALLPTTIQADVGEGGPFEVEVPFEISGEEPAFLLVYSTSPRDGAITHLSSVSLRLAESGPEDIRPPGGLVEQINIFKPLAGETISGGIVHVEGFGLASFEGTLVVEVLDENGVLIGSMPLIVEAPDIGMMGTYSVDVPYTLAAAGPGRIVVRDPSVAYPGDFHVATIEVFLEP